MSAERRTPEGVRVELPAAGEPAGYEVRVGAGAWEELSELLRERCPAHRYAVISDERVAELYGARVLDAAHATGAGAELFRFPAGEAYKTRDSWAQVSDAMLRAGLGRDSAVLALGGGVVGDLAGFVAATYMRGVPLVQLPTTLLAMIDSSVGGKTGVDTHGGKNLIGAFHQPRVVVADVDTLRTLPVEELRAGLAEAVKHGAIADAAYLEWIEGSVTALLQAEGAALTRLITRSVEIKAGVVARDERESGPRKMLNFGHTIGHAVEALSGFRLLHGEAIAIGMVAEARLGERLEVTEPGTAERLRQVLTLAGLPTSIPGSMEADRMLEATRVDKKARAGRVGYSLLERLGAASPGADESWSWPVDDALVLEVVAECTGARR